MMDRTELTLKTYSNINDRKFSNITFSFEEFVWLSRCEFYRCTIPMRPYLAFQGCIFVDCKVIDSDDKSGLYFEGNIAVDCEIPATFWPRSIQLVPASPPSPA